MCVYVENGNNVGFSLLFTLCKNYEFSFLVVTRIKYVLTRKKMYM